MPDLKIDSINLFLFFVLPGFIAIKVYDQLVPPEKRDFTSSLIDAVSYSLCNFAIWSWLVLPSVSNKINESNPYWFSVQCLIVSVLSPGGLAVGCFLLKTHWSQLCYKFKFAWAAGWIDHPTKTAWNYFFHRRPPCFMLFHLKNGSKVGGYFGHGSYAATYPHAPEVYIAQVWGLDDKGHFHEPIPDSAGMLVRFSDCDLIEVFFSEGESCNEQQATLVLAGGSQARGDAAQQATNSPNPSETTERWIGSVETYPTETKPTAVGG